MATSGRVAIITAPAPASANALHYFCSPKDTPSPWPAAALTASKETAAESGAGERALVVQSDVTDPAAVTTSLTAPSKPSAASTSSSTMPAAAPPRRL